VAGIGESIRVIVPERSNTLCECLLEWRFFLHRAPNLSCTAHDAGCRSPGPDQRAKIPQFLERARLPKHQAVRKSVISSIHRSRTARNRWSWARIEKIRADRSILEIVCGPVELRERGSG